MLEIDEKAPGIFDVKMGTPEMHIVRKIAAAYSFNDATALTAIINRGMDSLSKHVSKVDKHNGSTDDHSQDDTGG